MILFPNLKDTNVAGELPEKQQRVQQDPALDILLGAKVSTTSSTRAQEELEEYSERPAAQSDPPLAWWQKNEHRFPHLAHVACGILGIPATSTPAVFSMAGLTVTKLRSCLKPSNVDALVFLNINLKSLS